MMMEVPPKLTFALKSPFRAIGITDTMESPMAPMKMIRFRTVVR